MKKFIYPFVVLAIASIAGSPATAAVAGVEGPWSILVAGEVPLTAGDGYLVPVLISTLDGESPSTYSVVTKPGKKLLVLDTPRTARDKGPSHKRLELEMAPCMRYYVVDKKSAASSLRWAPEVFRIEPIGKCLAEFKLTAGAK